VTRTANRLSAVVDNTAARVFVHPDGRCESGRVGSGTRIWAFAHVLQGAVIGRECNICDHAFVEGDAVIGDRVTVKNGVLIWDGVTIGDDAFIGPGVVFTNDLTPRAHVKKSGDELTPTVVRSGATIGANSTVVCGVTIGRHAFVAAGSVVTRDVVDHAMVRGNPARQSGWVCMCGAGLDAGLVCSCGRSYRVLDGRLTDVEPLGVQPLDIQLKGD
jgi:UDP-2-acetamido-3-amino-2,3-dideoxy-glucuronate N-acetyltransferase